MRFLLLLAAGLLVACAPAPVRVEQQKSDPAELSWYGPAVEQLKALNRDALAAFQKRDQDRAAELIQKAQPIANRLLGVNQPNVAATEAASDLDDLYGRMLFSNQHYGWARLQFQKNAVRWRIWKPQTEDTERRRKAAEAAIAECDRHMME